MNPTKLQIERNIKLELEHNLMLFRIGKKRNSSTLQKKHINNVKNKLNKKGFGLRFTWRPLHSLDIFKTTNSDDFGSDG